jgi:hypothetical protein
MDINELIKISEDYQIPKNLLKMVIEKSMYNSLEHIYGKDKEYLINMGKLTFKIIEENQIEEISFKDIIGQMIHYLRPYLTNYLHDLNPEKFTLKVNIEEEIQEIQEFLREFYQEENDNDYDPYEGFQWGGLTGEEAYIGFWNKD